MSPASSKFEVRCLRCNAVYPEGFVARCPACQGAVDVFYHQTPRIREAEANPLRRYFEFLPLLDEEGARWFGAPEPTPCFHARTLGDAVGHPRLWLKDETKCPTRTTKDRMASLVLSYFREIGLFEFVTSSTGNSSTSLAVGAIAMPEFTLHLYCGEAFLYAMNWPDAPNVKLYVLKGATFVEAFDFSREHGSASGRIMERGFFNPARREGLKTAFMEAAEQVPAPIDWYFQATSSGMGVFGTYKGAKELLAAGVISRLPRLCCVQQESCSPQATAWEEGSPVIQPHHIVAQPFGPARAILRGNPSQVYPYMREILTEAKGTFAKVSAAAIEEARELVRTTEGLEICHASACTVAGLRQLLARGVVSRDETVLLNLTGADREFAHPAHYSVLERTPAGWVITGTT
jgi:threonine synthase